MVVGRHEMIQQWRSYCLGVTMAHHDQSVLMSNLVILVILVIGPATKWPASQAQAIDPQQVGSWGWALPKYHMKTAIFSKRKPYIKGFYHTISLFFAIPTYSKHHLDLPCTDPQQKHRRVSGLWGFHTASRGNKNARRRSTWEWTSTVPTAFSFKNRWQTPQSNLTLYRTPQREDSESNQDC